MNELFGTVIEGYGYASPLSPTHMPKGKEKIPWGTILLQSPHFAKLGLDLDAYFDRCLRPGNWQPGTMNISVEPFQIVELKPDYIMRDVIWYVNGNGVPTKEDFLLTELLLEYDGREYKGLHYFVDPTTKSGSPQPKTMLEVIGEPIPGLRYGDTITVKIDPDKIVMAPAGLGDILTLPPKAVPPSPQ